jgi:hypothetical protein
LSSLEPSTLASLCRLWTLVNPSALDGALETIDVGVDPRLPAAFLRAREQELPSLLPDASRTVPCVDEGAVEEPRSVGTREVDVHVDFAGDLRSVGEAGVVQGDHRVRVEHATAPGRRLDEVEVDLGQDSPVVAGVHVHLPFPERLISLATTFQAGFGTPATGE